MTYQLEGHKLIHHLDRVALWVAGGDMPPVTVEISPSSVCNHRCLMCGYDYLGHRLGVMDEALLVRVSDELARAGVRGLVFAGDGEPFVNRGLIRAIKAGKSAGADVAVSTNGSLLRREDFADLAENLSWIRFSINGGSDDDYSVVHRAHPSTLSKVLKNLETLASEKARCGSSLTLGVQMVILPENIHGAAQLAKEVRQCGADYFVMKPFYHHPSNAYGQTGQLDYQEHAAFLQSIEALSTPSFVCRMRWDTVDNRVRRYGQCLGWPFFLFVRTDGALMSCLARQGEEALSFGNLAAKSFDELWSPENRQRVGSMFEVINVFSCQPNCRQHAVNTFLWDITRPVEHRNFL